MEFRLLGPVELWADGRRCELGTAKERLVLAILLLSPGQVVTTKTLINHLWDMAPPAKPRQNLYSYVTRLRDRLAQAGDVQLPSRSGGYVLEVGQSTVDVHHFQQRRAQARAIAESGDDEHAIELYREAARLWQAEPLADLSGEWVLRTRKSLEDQLLAATFERVDLELQHGHHSDLVGELSELVARYPYHEQLTDLLMRALYGCGRQTDALEVYRSTRTRLVDEVGTEPAPHLRELHQRILKGDPSLLYVPTKRLDTGRPPNTLPRDIQITGRQSDIRRLVDGLPHQHGPHAPAGSSVNVITIDGMPGVGKTTLAVHLAHELVPHYPDAQLFLSLHAHDRRTEAVDPATALGTLLRSLGVPQGRIPRTLDDRTALWRAQLARSRALIVLDDAAESDQILPLLPGSPGCLTIVTSRRRLVGLDDVCSHSLDVLPPEDAVRLFGNVVGSDRPMDGEDLDAVVQRCGHLPLGISIAGGKLRQHSTWTVADLLSRLEQDNRRLDELSAADRAVATVFEMSYRELSEDQRAAFRLFGLHPGPTLTPPAAAALISAEVTTAERILEDLHERHLINEVDRGRFAFHDLLRDYALYLAANETPANDRNEAIRRILDFYLSGADLADRLLYPQRRRIDIATHPAPTLRALDTELQAQSWFTAELDNLLNAANYADQHGWSAHIVQFGHVLAEHLESRGYWAEASALHARAISVWEGMGDQEGMARALADFSRVRFRSSQYDDALVNAEKALAIYRSMADKAGEAEILDHIGVIRWHQSSFEDALASCHSALQLWRSLNDRRGIALGLDHSAIYLEYLGRYGEASSKRRRALDIYAEIGDQRGQQMALNNMGDLNLRLGKIEAALDYYEKAAGVAPIMGRQHEAILLGNMANIHQHTGRHTEALDGYRKALRIHQELGDKRGEIETLIGIGLTFQRLEKHSEALIHHQKALSAARAISERYEETKALRCIGGAMLGSGRYSHALDYFRLALRLSDQISEMFEKAKALEGIGSALLQLEGRNHAEGFWKKALNLYERLSAPEASVVRSYLQEPGDDLTSTA